jgi:hypothetical protein
MVLKVRTGYRDGARNLEDYKATRQGRKLFFIALISMFPRKYIKNIETAYPLHSTR